jgi:hypothetical protein
MTQNNTEKSHVKQAGEDLFNFALNREDVKFFVENLPPGTKCQPTAVEYELQLLKIITTGWALSFFLENDERRDRLAEHFWHLVREFSAGLSETTGLMTGHNIDYFQVIKERLDTYVDALAEKPETTEPAVVIGPVFAGLCGDGDDIYSVMTGSRMFKITLARVQEYLDTVTLD